MKFGCAAFRREIREEPRPFLNGRQHSERQQGIVQLVRIAHDGPRFIPDFFDFSPIGDNKSTLTETIGNAVPPKLSYVLALELLR